MDEELKNELKRRKRVFKDLKSPIYNQSLRKDIARHRLYQKMADSNSQREGLTPAQRDDWLYNAYSHKKFVNQLRWELLRRSRLFQLVKWVVLVGVIFGAISFSMK